MWTTTVTQKQEMSKYCWKKDPNRLAWHRVPTTFNFYKTKPNEKTATTTTNHCCPPDPHKKKSSNICEAQQREVQ